MSDDNSKVQRSSQKKLKENVMAGWVIVHVNKKNFHTVYKEPVPHKPSWSKLRGVVKVMINVYRSVY